ncbi:MAG: MaoC family dehydratase [Rhodospirillaceae bacterium]|nr:MaoC family dehydratase [Rhodospirillaceae bacterium]
MGIPGYGLKTVNDFVGQELGVSSWHLIDQDRINAFAACTGDDQWIHVDVARAKAEGPFGGTIAHGYLTLSLLAPMQMEVGVIPEDAGQAINFGLDSLRFLSPVPAGSRIRMRFTLQSVEDRGKGRLLLRTKNTMEIEGSDKPAFTAESLALVW